MQKILESLENEINIKIVLIELQKYELDKIEKQIFVDIKKCEKRLNETNQVIHRLEQTINTIYTTI